MEDFDTSNLQKCEILVAKILKHIAELGFQDEIMSFDDLKLDASYGQFYDASIRWLIAEGIIRSNGFSEYATGPSRLIGPAITSHGFSLLTADSPIAGSQNSATKVVEEVSKGAEGKWQIGDLLGGVLGGFVKSMGNG